MTRLALPLTALLALIGCGTDTGSVKETGDSNTTIGCDEDGDGFCPSDGDCDEADAMVNPGAQEACDGVDNNCDGGVDEGLTSTWYSDGDGDGYGDDSTQYAGCDPGAGWTEEDGDCNDGDAAINPGAAEACNEVDDNCDNQIDEGLGGTWYQDVDGDGYGDLGTEWVGCDPGAGWVDNGDDCDDADQFINPGAEETCNGVDDDCNGYTDDGLTSLAFADTDNDGYGDPANMSLVCPGTIGYVDNDEDCDDSDGAVNPAAIEICDGIDNDCDAGIDEGVTSTYYMDSDSDSYGDPATAVDSCSSPGREYVTNDDDCNDAEPLAYDGATEVCDEVDNDCDGSVDEGVSNTYYRDGDGDTYGDPSTSVTACSDPGDTWVSNDNDCNDTEALAYNGAAEVCDEVDNDCDGRIDENVTSTWYADSDGDTYGDPASAVDSCASPGDGYTSNANDCNDSEPAAWTGASEVCDSIDNDCDGTTDEDPIDGSDFPADEDGDGFGDALNTVTACSGVDNTLDCDDTRASEPQVADVNSTSTSPDGSILAPWTTVQDAIDAATECVLVMPGTYRENIDFGGKDLLVQSYSSYLDTVLLGVEGWGSVVSFVDGETVGAELSGFTIAGGSGTLEDSVESAECGSSAECAVTTHNWYGGGIYVNGAAPTLSDLSVRSNVLPGFNYEVVDSTHEEYTYSYGGGIAVMNSTGTSMSQVDLALNYADNGGGLAVGSGASATFWGGWISYNTAVTNGGGVAVLGGSFSATNAGVVDNNASSYGGGLYFDDATGDLENISVVANGATDGGGIAAMGMTSLDLLNSIVVSSTSGDGISVDSGASFDGMYNDVYGNSGSNYSGISDPTGTSGNLSMDPMFTSWTDDDTDNDDLSLASGSPCFNTGNPSMYDVDGSRADMGAYGGANGSW